MTYQVVIPMSGLGQRFVDAGYQELKPLIRAEGKTIVEHVLNTFSGAEKVICIVSKDHKQKQALINEILRVRSDVVLIEIPRHKLGPGYAVLQARHVIDLKLPTLVSYCDWAGSWSVDQMIEQLRFSSGSILTYTGFHPHMLRGTQFAYVMKIDELVVDIQEKQSYTDSPMREEASAGCYGFSSGSLLIRSIEKQIKRDESFNGEFYLSLTYKNLIRSGAQIRTILMDKFYQWGTPEDFEDWHYWNKSIQSLPGTAEGAVDAHNVVLAAGRGSRVSEVSKVSKPNITIEGQHLWEYSAPPQIRFISNILVTRPEVGIVVRNDVKEISIKSVTEGQAISASIGIENIEQSGFYPINVMSSDNAFTPEIFQEAVNLVQKNHLIVWTAKSYPPSKIYPRHYSWINPQTKTVIKKDFPPNFVDWEVVIGNFTFKDAKVALSLIQELVLKNIHISGEYYLDSLIDLAVTRGMDVQTLHTSNFLAVGTPQEFLTYRYFAKNLESTL